MKQTWKFVFRFVQLHVELKNIAISPQIIIKAYTLSIF